MRAVILTIGDELLIGQVLNTNAAWLGEQLGFSGIDVMHTVTVGDDLETLTHQLGVALDGSDLVITTGGLGPTIDDVTREALAAYFGVELTLHPEILEYVEGRFSHRHRVMPASNRNQAMVPDGFEVLWNPVGSAPGLWREDAQGHMLAVLPGVPHEMKRLFRDEVLPRLIGRDGLHVIAHRTLRTAGIGESILQEEIGDLSDLLSVSLRLAYLPGTAGVQLRLYAFGETRREVDEKLDRLERRLRDRIDAFVYGYGDDSMESVVGKLLLRRSLHLAVAESCTGGHVANQITNVPGSSAYLTGGVVAYSNEAKVSILGVDPAVLESEGAVSEEVAIQMAAGVRARLGADIGISTTGVAGPWGGTPDKPVGTVWIGYADQEGSEAVLLHLVEDRLLNKELTTTNLLNLVRKKLL